MADRATGQDTLFTMIFAGDILEEFLAQDVTVEAVQPVSSERILGEGSNRYQEIYEGHRMQVSGQAEGSGARGVLAMFKLSNDRAQRKSIGQKIAVSSVLLFPNGDQSKFTAPDCKIENPQYQMRGAEFITFSFTAMCSNGKLS